MKKPKKRDRTPMIFVYYQTPFYHAQVCCRTCRTGENIEVRAFDGRMMYEEIPGRRRKKPTL
jgi:hypothetical protein